MRPWTDMFFIYLKENIRKYSEWHDLYCHGLQLTKVEESDFHFLLEFF